MKITIISGSRADWGLLQWPIKLLQEDSFFEGRILKIWGASVDLAHIEVTAELTRDRPDVVLLLGDRYEILAAATAAHLLRVPIAHIGGGDVTEGSYDDAMRDCISRMSSIQFVTSASAMARLSSAGLRGIHLVGNPGVDFIQHAQWRGPRPIAEPYVVVNYQAETIDADPGGLTNDFANSLPTVKRVFMLPNPDAGSEKIKEQIDIIKRDEDIVYDFLPHDEYLNLIAHCDCLIGNSSSLLYEAPFLGIKTKMIGRRQKGRAIPEGDGKASERIVRILKHCAL